MKIETTTKQSFPAVVLRGDFDTDAVDDFLATIDEIRAGGNARIMVSFRYVKYINSTALGAVVRARSACKEAGGDLIIVQPSRLSREIITKMGLENVLRIFDDEVEAAGHLERGGSAVGAATAEHSGDSPETISVMFSFEDERAKLIPGKSRRHGVGVLESVDSSSLVFGWNPAKHESDIATAEAMFPVGSKVRSKLQLKLIRKEFFEADSTVESMTVNDSGTVTVRTRWSRIADADRDALARYEQDLDFLRKQAGETATGDS